MVEPLTIGSIIAVLVAKTVERAEDKALDQGEGALRQLVERLRQRLAGCNDSASTTALERLEQVPDSPRLKSDFAETLDAHAANEPSFRSELETLVAEVRDAGVDVESITQIALGSGNIQIAGVANSEIKVTGAQPRPTAPPASDDP